MHVFRYTIQVLLMPYAAFERFYKMAMETTPVICRADVPVVVSNVDAAFRIIGPRVGELSSALPKHDLRAMLDMPNLARALLLAARRVVTLASSGDISKKLAECRTRRGPMLLVAEAFALLGLLPRARVAKIREGNGPFDTACDLLDLVGLFREFAEQLAGKHPFDDTWLAECEKLGSWLLANITPSGAAKPATSETSEAARVRDGLWAMMLDRDVMLRLAINVLLDPEQAALIPSLQSRVASPPAAAPVVTAPVDAPPVVAASDAQPAAPANAIVVQAMTAPGNSTPPAAIRSKPAQVREQGARARRKR